MSITVHDITIDDTHFIMEVTLDDNGGSYITLTEACQDAEEEICMHEAYDFKEVF